MSDLTIWTTTKLLLAEKETKERAINLLLEKRTAYVPALQIAACRFCAELERRDGLVLIGRDRSVSTPDASARTGARATSRHV